MVKYERITLCRMNIHTHIHTYIPYIRLYAILDTSYREIDHEVDCVHSVIQNILLRSCIYLPRLTPFVW